MGEHIVHNGQFRSGVGGYVHEIGGYVVTERDLHDIGQFLRNGGDRAAAMALAEQRSVAVIQEVGVRVVATGSGKATASIETKRENELVSSIRISAQVKAGEGVGSARVEFARNHDEVEAMAVRHSMDAKPAGVAAVVNHLLWTAFAGGDPRSELINGPTGSKVMLTRAQLGEVNEALALQAGLNKSIHSKVDAIRHKAEVEGRNLTVEEPSYHQVADRYAHEVNAPSTREDVLISGTALGQVRESHYLLSKDGDAPGDAETRNVMRSDFIKASGYDQVGPTGGTFYSGGHPDTPQESTNVESFDFGLGGGGSLFDSNGSFALGAIDGGSGGGSGDGGSGGESGDGGSLIIYSEGPSFWDSLFG